MSSSDIAETARFALIFGLPALVLAVFCHAYLPLRTWTVLAVLLVAELALFEFDFVYENAQAVPGVVLGLVAGNLLAIPIARGLRSLFNASAGQ